VLRSLECDQKPKGGVEGPGIPLRPRSRKQAFRAADGFKRQLGRAFEKGGGRSEASARLRASRGAVELLGDVLVGAGGGVGPVPGVSVRVDLGVCRFCQRTVRFLSLLKGR
jgi:hypothetical protein